MNMKVFVALSLLVAVSNAYKILFLASMNGKSHFLFMSSFVKAAVERGHEVTFLSSNSLKHLNLANYTEILVDPPLDLASSMPQEKFVDMGKSSVFSNIHDMKVFPYIWNNYALENANVQKFIKSTGLHFDVVVAEEFFNDSFLMFAHKHKAPIVTICPFGIPDWVDRQQGLLSSPSFVAHWMMPYTDNLTFMQRWYNTIVVIFDWGVRSLGFLPAEDELARKYFADFAPLPPIVDIVRNISITLVNTHRATSPPRPAMPSVIPIGGAHIKSPKPLPNDLKSFLDEAKDGAIYFSLGSVLQSALLSKQTIQDCLDTFKNLKQRVLWKFEDDSLTNIPSNVMVRKWLPQNDILAHPNMVLFISHGGLFGTSESLYHGVPLLIIPFFGDQFRNAHRIAAGGYGKYMDHREINKEVFPKSITEIVDDPSFLDRARQTSAVFKDNLVHPMDEAMFWIEHVAKFKGAKHFKSHAVNLSWFRYLLLDVIAANVLALYVIYLLLRMIFMKLFGKNISKNAAEKKQKKN